MELKKYSLVEWTNEADAGSYSVVNSDWILGYTPEMYLIEWREGQGRKKPPPGGWPMGEAKILKSSDKEVDLKKELREMTSIKKPAVQSDLVVTGKRRRIPKKRLYESDEETDTDAYRSSGDEKKRARGAKKENDDGSQPSSQDTTGQAGSQKSTGSTSEVQSQSQSQSEGQDQTDPSQSQERTYKETSSDRDAEDSTSDDAPMENGHTSDRMDQEEEEGSEVEYPPEYELSELEKLRLEVRGLRDEIMLLRHQVCKELPKVHAIALKALGMQTSDNNHHMVNNHQQSGRQSTTSTESTRAVGSAELTKKGTTARSSKRPVKKTFATKPSPGNAKPSASLAKPSPNNHTRQVKTKAALKKEAEIFRQKIQLERASGKPRVMLSPTKLPAGDRNTPSPASTPRRQPAYHKPIEGQVEIHPGTGVFIDQDAWEKLNELDQATAFARRLLPFVFDTETLMNCNLRGGKSTRDVNAAPKKALDQDRVDAIYKSVIAKFPDTAYCDIGQAINGRLSSIRYRYDKRQARLQRQGKVQK